MGPPLASAKPAVAQTFHVRKGTFGEKRGRTAAFVTEMKAALDRVRVAAPRGPGERRLTDHKTVQDVHNAIEFGLPTAFVDPRRVMLGIRINLGKP